MVSLPALWLPILLSTVAVFIVSSIIHTFLKYHATDFTKIPNEEALRSALRPLNIPPGDYMVPHMRHDEMKEPANSAKYEQGPVALLTVLPNGIPSMGKSLGLWFAFCLLVSVFAAYVAGRTLGSGADGMMVLRVTGTVAFAGFALGLLHDSIWYCRKWSTTLKFVFDGLVYGVVVGAIFCWLWPAA